MDEALTLGDLGMDSLMGMAVHQAVRQATNLNPTMVGVRDITIKDLKEM